MTWAAIITLVVGAYLFKLSGVAIGTIQHRASRRQLSEQDLADPQSANGDESDVGGNRLFDRLGQLVPPAVLFGLIVSQTVSTEGMLVADARLVGVGVGTIAAWRQAPFWVVLLVSAAAAAAVRAFTGIA